MEEYKLSEKCPIERIPEPPTVMISMNQHIGAPTTPTVSIGDTVKVGQIIGAVPENVLGCPVHSSVSGTVKAIESGRVPTGVMETVIVIENDGNGTVDDSVKPFTKSILDTPPDEIIDVVRRAGITGMGGAAFPTYAKIKSAIGKAELLIVNCAECEPFITSDHRLLLEHPEDIIGGVKILLKAVGVRKAFIAIEDNKPDAIDLMKKLTAEDELVDVKVMKTKYPQGDERQLIYALTGKELPMGKLPADAGCVIFNAATCHTVYRAFSEGMPSVRRIVTVSGDCIKEPKNLSVPVGTSAAYLAEYCGGFTEEPSKIIFGGPMMGFAQWNREMPVKKSTSSILFLSDTLKVTVPNPGTCIRCGKCVNNCPMHLMPAYIAQFVMKDDMKNAEKYGAMSCVECGTCSFNCPGKVEIVQYIRVAKNHIRTEAARIKAAKEQSGK